MWGCEVLSKVWESVLGCKKSKGSVGGGIWGSVRRDVGKCVGRGVGVGEMWGVGKFVGV